MLADVAGQSSTMEIQRSCAVFKVRSAIAGSCVQQCHAVYFLVVPNRTELSSRVFRTSIVLRFFPRFAK